MERCPNCRARRDGGPTCRRCGMDLNALLAVERAVETLTARAVAHLAAAAVPAAIDALVQARRLSAEPFTGHLLGFSRDLSMRPLAQRAPDEVTSATEARCCGAFLSH